MKQLLKWMTLLSLDAPLVAIAWQRLLAQTWETEIGWNETIIVFVSVWLGYVGDRWLDANRKVNAISHRHNWYRLHKKTLFTLWILVLIASISYAVITLSSNQLLRGSLLSVACILYTLFAQKGRWLPIYGRMKSVLIACLIGASAAIFTQPIGGTIFLVSPIFLLPTALFYINCQYIRIWDERPGANPKFVLTCSILVLFASIVMSFLSPEFSAMGATIALSLAGLWSLDQYQLKLDTTIARALADVALMTPAITLILT